jgi:hypothetical protein
MKEFAKTALALKSFDDSKYVVYTIILLIYYDYNYLRKFIVV